MHRKMRTRIDSSAANSLAAAWPRLVLAISLGLAGCIAPIAARADESTGAKKQRSSRQPVARERVESGDADREEGPADPDDAAIANGAAKAGESADPDDLDDASDLATAAGEASAPLAISPSTRDDRRSKTAPGIGDGGRRSSLGAFGPTLAALAMVLALFGAMAWRLRKVRPKALQPLPVEVFEALGRAPLAGRMQVHLFRCGNKLLLVSMTPGGAETLTEIVDPLEVDRLAGLCRESHPQSTTMSFRQIWQQFAKEKATSTFVDSPLPPPPPPPAPPRGTAPRAPVVPVRGRESLNV